MPSSWEPDSKASPPPLRLSELGARVVLLESLACPGGCASTFERDGYRFEAGATLFSGLGEGQLFRRWIDRYRLDVPVGWLDPVVELRSPAFTLAVPRRRREIVERLLGLAALEGAPLAEALTRFFKRQGVVADTLSGLLDEPEARGRRHLSRTEHLATAIGGWKLARHIAA